MDQNQRRFDKFRFFRHAPVPSFSYFSNKKCPFGV